MWSVYSLSDPRDGKVRYIGCTSRSVRRRLGSHLREAGNPNSPYYNVRRNRWIREVVEEGLRPIPRLIQEFPTQEAGWAGEQFFIAQIRGQLVNETAGGAGVLRPSEDVRQRRAEAVSKSQKAAWARDDGTRRARMREVALANPDKIRKAIAAGVAKRTGKPLPPEWKANVAAATQRPEVKAKIAAKLRGQKRSPEIRAKMSEAQRKRWAEKRARDATLQND